MDERQKRKELPSIRTSDPSMNTIAPSRSRTDPAAPEMHRQEKEKSHLHRRLHSSSLRHRAFTGSKDKESLLHNHHHIRHTAKETVQSAIELRPPINFDTLLRRDKKNPDSSRIGSESQQTSQQVEAAELRTQRAAEAERRRVKPEQVRKAKRDNAKREEELRESLKNVEEVAMSSTRQLDDTYYSILEKASILRSTVVSLQELAQESRRMHSQFQQDSTELEQETRKNLDGFGHFNAQEQRIDQLVHQLTHSKTKTKKLNDRLDAARNRVAAFEQRENAKQSASRKRWNIVWCVLAGFVALLIALLVARRHSAVGSRLHRVTKMLENDVASPIVSVLLPSASPSEDPYLKKLFDDL